MQTPRYFDEQVIRKRPYVERALVEQVLRGPLARHRRPDGRWRVWGEVIDPRSGTTRAFRVVMLDDGETVHNAFFDRDFKVPLPRSCLIIPRLTASISN